MPDSTDKNRNGKEKQPNTFIKYSALATQMAVITVVGALGGIQLDKYFQTEIPWFTGGLTVLAVILSMYFAIKDLLKG